MEMVLDKKKNHSICAGIILYNPEIDLLKKNIDALESQICKIFLFDNNSTNHSEITYLIENYSNIEYIHSNENTGIASALEYLLNLADERKFDWILTMDQDSICSENMIHEYELCMSKEEDALICPFVLNNGKYTFDAYKKMNLPKYDYVLKPIDCITSGCLTNVSIIKKLGGFFTDLFIDGVDTELNCRVLKHGYRIKRVNSAYLIQQMGKARKVFIFNILYKITKLNFFRRLQVAAVYNNTRLYYIARNNRIIHKKHPNSGFRTSTPFTLLLFVYFSIFYPISHSRILMWKNIIRGYKEAAKYV